MESGRRGIGGLRGVPDGANCGGKKNEEVEVVLVLTFGKAVMQVPCPLNFGREGGRVVCQRHVLEEGVLERLVLNVGLK